MTASSIESMAEHGISVADLAIISLAKVHGKDPAELALLQNAASTTGFFYLDLRGDPEGERVLTHLPGVYAAEEQYFAQPEEAKRQGIRHDTKVTQDIGWKTLPGGESFEISRDEIALKGADITRLPQLFRDEWKAISEFIAGCDKACLALLDSLSADFRVHHRSDEPSDTGLKMVLHPSLPSKSDAGGGIHTDSGTITLLFYTEWGIRTFLPDENIWAFTPPLDGCALINVANSLQRLSGGKYHSPKHGVSQPFDGVKNRYYLSYFLRPETALLEEWDAAK